jgi:C4-dicarboxylate-specific signal transduction histidine kinase
MPDGSVKQIRVVARAVAVDPAGLTLAGAVIDLTDSIRTQTLLQRLQSDFAHAARISTLGELTASIAHELNQPIAGIILNGQTGLRRLDRPEPDLAGIRASTGRILRDAQRASDIIARIRGMAQRRAPHRSLVRIEDLVEETLVFLRHEIRSFAVSVLEDLTQAASEVLVDRIQLQQVVVNLMVNAMQAIAQAGSADRKITIRTTVLEDRMVRCAVEDSGPGIDPSRAKRLFDSFFTTKQDGMGIGLSVCRSIVEAHGGQIGADNDSIHGGARFYFTLPAADKSS